MAVTTEPPWINKASGVSRTNATSETINFGFTATPGNFLVFIIGGAVTHTVSAGGWTERAQPVDSAELSLFTAAATSSPNNLSSIAVTHNGANYPCPWVCYEFPSGTTYTTITSITGSNGLSFPQLSGLPGSAQVVIAAMGNAHTSTLGTRSATCSSPWVEDFDSDTPRGGSPSADGEWLYVMRQINVTATSITPTFTPPAGDGNYAGDVQRVVAAFNVAAAAAPPAMNSGFFAMM